MAHQVTDIEDIIKTWAWTYFKKNHPSAVFSEHILEVNWDNVQFRIGEVHYHTETHDDESDPRIVFKSNFDNFTDKPQENVFRTERTTTASITSSIQKGYRKNWNIGLTLALPESVATATAGYGRDVTITKSNQYTQSTQLKWGIDTKIITEAKKRTVATLFVEERKTSVKFKTEVKIKGEVGVRISVCLSPLNPPYYLQNDITTILYDNKSQISSNVTFSENKSFVTWQVEGNLDFKYAVQQNVSIKYMDLPNLH